MLCDRTKKEGAAMWQRTKRAREISTTPSTHDRFTARTERNREAEIQIQFASREHWVKGDEEYVRMAACNIYSCSHESSHPFTGGCKFGQVTRSLSQLSVILRVNWYS